MPQIDTTLSAQFRSTVETYPNHTAVHHRGQDLSYRELGRRARLVAAWLSAQGVSTGHRVALVLPNSFDYVASFYGILLAGCCAVPVNPDAPPEEIGRILAHSQASGVILSQRTSRALETASVSLDDMRFVAVADPHDSNEARHARAESLQRLMVLGDASWPAPVSPDDPAQIIYTSGTTGRSKGVTLQHRALAANCRSIVTYLSLSTHDSVFVSLPFFYSYGASLLTTHIAVGGRLVLATDFVFLGRALDLMRDQHATGLAGVPSTFNMLLRNSDFLKRSFPDLRYMTCAGGALSPDAIRVLRETFPNIDYFAMYGQTEASARLSTLLPAELEAHLGSIGRGIPGVELLVADDEGRPVPPDVVGEIVARGENLMMGYWRDPETTAQVLRPEGLRTGDLARVDEDGYIYIIGRKNDLIKSGAYRIGPQEIEDVLRNNAAVLDVAVVGKPDHILGEVPAAFVVVDPECSDCSASDLMRFANERLPRYMALRDVRFVDELPKTASGKVRRQSLRSTLTVEDAGSPPHAKSVEQ